jgi:predicted transcriptional regulator
MPEVTHRALAQAHANDLAPLRKASQPLLAAIEAGNLDVVGELEAFIAKLDALAPKMVGASELANVLEAALAEAAIAGAAHSYAKLPTAKDHPSK